MSLMCHLLKLLQWNMTFRKPNPVLYMYIILFICVQFVVHEAPGQELEVELYDEDTDKDDFIGR